MSGGFQTAVNDQPAIGVAGDFSNTNPCFNVAFGPGGAVAGPNGVAVGRFAWATPPTDGDGAPATISNSGAGPVTGFVRREQQGLITTYLADASMVIPQGFQMALFSGGDFLVKNDGVGQALPGMKAYANLTTGKVNFAATGAATAGATSTGSTVTPETLSVTGSIANNVLTVTAVGSGSVVPGATLSGSGVASGTKITSQVSGTANGVGVYLVSIPEQNVSSETITGTYGLLTIGTATGTFSVGQALVASGAVVAGTTITASVTGSGGSGATMVVDNNTSVSSQNINVVAVNVETKWIAMSSGLAGELVKISDHPLG